jgi:hypothetical protein
MHRGIFRHKEELITLISKGLIIVLTSMLHWKCLKDVFEFHIVSKSICNTRVLSKNNSFVPKHVIQSTLLKINHHLCVYMFMNLKFIFLHYKIVWQWNAGLGHFFCSTYVLERQDS